MHWYYGGMGPHWLGWLLMVITIVVFLGGLAMVSVILMRRLHGTATPSRDVESPLDILAGRFARGEIDEEEYRRRRDLMRE
jgi:putative membrane protein